MNSYSISPRVVRALPQGTLRFSDSQFITVMVEEAIHSAERQSSATAAAKGLMATARTCRDAGLLSPARDLYRRAINIMAADAINHHVIIHRDMLTLAARAFDRINEILGIRESPSMSRRVRTISAYALAEYRRDRYDSDDIRDFSDKELEIIRAYRPAC